MESTQGDSWHIGVNVELPLTKRLSCGFQADYLAIRTSGTTHEVNVPQGIDRVWDNGVCTYSNQTGLTSYLRLTF
jgi:hypothetical protein